MMSLETIRQLSLEAGERAAREGKRPYVPYNVDEIDDYRQFPFPFLGEHVPQDWEQTEDEWFMDSSGLGRDDEPALSTEQFKDALREYVAEHPGYGFAVTQAGQFQVYVAAYRPTNSRIGGRAA